MAGYYYETSCKLRWRTDPTFRYLCDERYRPGGCYDLNGCSFGHCKLSFALSENLFMEQKGGTLANVNASCGSPDTDHGNFINDTEIYISCFLRGKSQVYLKCPFYDTREESTRSTNRWVR